MSKQFLKIRTKVSRARLPQRVVCFSVWEEKVEKCCFACSYRRVRAEWDIFWWCRWRAALHPAETRGGLWSVSPHKKKKKKKKQLELSFLEILQMNSHANRHTQLILPYAWDKDGEKKKKKMYCTLDITFEWELYVGQMSGCMGLNCLPGLREIYRITLISGQLPG